MSIQFRKISQHLLSPHQQSKLVKKVHSEIHQHRRVLSRKRKKIGRIHLEEATPITLAEAQNEIKPHPGKKNRATSNMNNLKTLTDRNLESILGI